MTVGLLHGCATFILTGLIWVIQLVHYPMFRFLDPKKHTKAMQFHQSRISFLVVPLMLFELFSGVYLAILEWPILATFHVMNLSLIGIIWVHTFGLMVPFHRDITHSMDEPLLNQTLRHHWIRTVAWTIKTLVWVAIIWHLLPN